MTKPDRPLSQLDLFTVLERLPEPLLVLDREWRITYLNEAAGRFAGEVRAGEDLRRCCPGLFGAPFALDAARQALQGNEVVEVEGHLTSHGRRVRVRVFAQGDGLALHVRDSEPQSAAEGVLEERVEERTYQLLKANEELAARNRAFQAFAALSRELTLETDEVRLVERAQDRLLELLPEGASAYFELLGEAWHLRAARGVRGGLELARSWERRVQRRNLLGPLFEAREAVYLGADELARPATAPLLMQFSALAVLPVRFSGSQGSVLVVAFTRQRGWIARDRALLETAANQLQLALERARALALVKQHSALLEQHSSRLEELNAELEAFSHSVSHDLRAPVRHIGGFAALLGRRSAALDERDRKLLDSIVGAADRMDAMIRGLLAFSKVASRELRFAPVDLSALVGEVRSHLQPEQEQREVRWQVGPLPTVLGDAETLRMVFTNLLGNALKYTARRECAVIQVSAEATREEYIVSVRDNGAGFDARYAGKLFGVFQRLHRDGEFEGVGVGLSTVRRIVIRHGGRVWAEGEVGQGAAFHVALPRKEAT